MEKIKKVSSYLILVFQTMIFILPLQAILKWWLLNWSFYRQHILVGLDLRQRLIPKPLPLPEIYSNLSMLLGSLGSLIEIIPGILIFLTLISLFRNYQNGFIFSYKNSRMYNKIGKLLIWYALLALPLGGSLISIGGSFSNPVGQRILTLSMGVLNLESLFCGIITIFISWIMMEGSRIEEEQKLTV